MEKLGQNCYISRHLSEIQQRNQRGKNVSELGLILNGTLGAENWNGSKIGKFAPSEVQ